MLVVATPAFAGDSNPWSYPYASEIIELPIDERLIALVVGEVGDGATKFVENLASPCHVERVGSGDMIQPDRRKMGLDDA